MTPAPGRPEAARKAPAAAIEVVVIGPDGSPVRGLGRDDFELFEDGEPVEISNFYSVDAAPSPLLDPEAGLAKPSPAVPIEQQLHLGIFVDGLTLQPADRRRVLQSIRDFGEDIVTALCTRLLEGGAPGLHFYTLNKAEPSIAIWKNLGLSGA